MKTSKDKKYCCNILAGEVRNQDQYSDIVVHDGNLHLPTRHPDYLGGLLKIAYCPWCGSKLKSRFYGD